MVAAQSTSSAGYAAGPTNRSSCQVSGEGSCCFSNCTIDDLPLPFMEEQGWLQALLLSEQAITDPEQ
jgi:hypothetical protein